MRYMIGFVFGVALTMGTAALAATQISAWMKVSCNDDGTLNVQTAPK